MHLLKTRHLHHSMTKIFSLFLHLLLFSSPLLAQTGTINIPMTSEHWIFDNGAVTFEEHEEVPTMRVTDGQGLVIAKDLVFENGTIEFDVMLSEQVTFTSFFFRFKSEEEGEWFYTRNYRIGDPTGFDAIQYAAQVKGVTLWDLHPHYQAPANLKADDWNHVKLVVSGERMRAYVNDMETPALDVGKLEGDVRRGRLAFQGIAQYANFVVHHNEVEGLPETASADPTHYDPRYLRQWEVSEPVKLPPGKELVGANDQITAADTLSGSRGLLFSDHWPDQSEAWHSMQAEQYGLINLTRRYGQSTERRAVWLKVNLNATVNQVRELGLGFSDEIWVLLNGQLLYVDKNIYASPGQKAPFGRISLENASVKLPLQAGENQLLIGVANSFFGWGLMARLDSIEGISVIP